LGIYAGPKEMVASAVLIIFVLLGMLLVLTESSAVAPLIYTIF
jgi:hypothetical protein